MDTGGADEIAIFPNTDSWKGRLGGMETPAFKDVFVKIIMLTVNFYL